MAFDAAIFAVVVNAVRVEDDDLHFYEKIMRPIAAQAKAAGFRDYTQGVRMSEKQFKPYVPPESDMKEFTIRALVIGLVAGRVFVNGWITRSWNKTRTEMEAELPSLLLRLNATLQTAQNVPSALEIVAKTLRADGPLRVWTLETANRMHAEGHGVIEVIRQSATGISMSLSIVAELIGRVWTTGGEGYGKAFGTAADNLESVLDARVLARSKGGSAQGTVNILTVMTFGMIAFMTRSPAICCKSSVIARADGM